MKKIKTLFILLLILSGHFLQAQIENVGSDEYGRLRDVQYHPTEMNRLFALTYSNHIVISEDNGETWDVLYSFPNSFKQIDDLKYLSEENSLSFSADNNLYLLNLETLEITDELIMPIPAGAGSAWIDSYYIYLNDSDIILVGQEFKVGNAVFSKTYYTTNRGQHWEEVYYSGDNDGVHINSVAINPDNPDLLYLFRGNGPEDIDGGLFISKDAGATWEEKLAGFTLEAYDFKPDNPNELLAGTSIGFGQHTEQLFRSTDAGTTWDAIPIDWTDKTLNNITKIVYNPQAPQTVIVLEENEVVVTQNNFDTWENYVYPEVDTHSYYYGLNLSFNPFEEGELYLTANYHVLHSDNNAADLEWAKNPFFSTTGQNINIFQSADARHLYYGVQFGFVHRNLETGEEYPYFVKPLNYVSNSPNTPMHIDKQVEGRVYIYSSGLSGHQLSVSTNHGADETAIYSSFKSTFSAVASFPSDRNTILASFSNLGSSPELVQINYNDLDNVEVDKLTLPENKYVTGIYIDSTDYILISIGGTIYKSTDYGETWEEYGEGLEELSGEQIFELAHNPMNENQFTIATTAGIFTSMDKGETWEKIKEGIYSRVEHSPIKDGQIVAVRNTMQAAFGAYYSYEIYYTGDGGDTWEEFSNEKMGYIQSNTSATFFNDDEKTADVFVGTSDLGLLKVTLDFSEMGVPDFPENQENNILLYPNPVENLLHIQTQNGVEVNHYAIYSIDGQKIMDSPASNEIEVSSLSSGIYLIKMKTNSGNEIVKRIIKK